MASGEAFSALVALGFVDRDGGHSVLMKKMDAFAQKMRLELRDKTKSYDPKVLALLKKARCNADPNRAECAQNLE